MRHNSVKTDISRVRTDTMADRRDAAQHRHGLHKDFKVIKITQPNLGCFKVG